jgi:hypothetical protein
MRLRLAAACILAAVLGVTHAGAVLAQERDPDQRPENFIDMRGGAVTIEEVTTEGDLPVAGYDPSPTNGAFIQSTNGQFRLQFGAFTQIRWNANWRDAPASTDPDEQGEDFTRGWSMNRTRLFLEGKYTDRSTYHFRANINNSFEFELLVAWAQLRLGDRWNLRIGKQFIPLSREDWMFAQDVLTAEYSPNDFTFAIGTSLGASASYTGDDQRVWLSLHNGAFGGREEFPSDETDLAVTARWEWNFVGTDWTVWDDMVGRRGRAKVMMLGLSGGYQSKQTDVSTQNESAAQFNFDLNFNGDGYQVVFTGSATWRDPVDGDSFTNYGLLAQGGYFVGQGSQLYAQYNLISPGDQPGDLEVFNSLAAGYNYFPYLWTNRWKLTAEGGYQFSALNQTIVEPSGSLGWLASDEKGQAYVKLQAQFGF